MIEAIVFDLDGTLLDTLVDLQISVNYAITYYGYAPITIEQARMFIGNGIKNLIERSLSGDNKHLEDAFLRFKKHYFKNYNNYTKAYDGIGELLEYIRSKNIKMAVVSNKDRIPLNELINSHFNGYFDVVIGDGEGLKRKPNPEVLVECARRLRVNVENMVYIGDSDVDVLTVTNTGCRGIFVDYGFRSRESLVSVGAKSICSNPIDIVRELEEL